MGMVRDISDTSFVRYQLQEANDTLHEKPFRVWWGSK
jgi:hypothetical protein